MVLAKDSYYNISYIELSDCIFRLHDWAFVKPNISFLYYDNKKWSNTIKIDIVGRNHILPSLGIAWKTKHGKFLSGNEND